MHINKKVQIFLILLFMVLSLSPCFGQNLKMVNHSTQAFSIKTPANWKILTGGSCSTSAVVARDIKSPLAQVMYFGEVGPVFLDYSYKQFFMNSAMYNPKAKSQADMPVVYPFNPKTLLENFSKIIETDLGKTFMPDAPSLSNLKVVKSIQMPSLISGTQTLAMYVTFRDFGRSGEGIIILSTVTVNQLPGQQMGDGLMMYGITAPKGKLVALQPILNQILSSIYFNDNYLSGCLASQQAAYNSSQEMNKHMQKAFDDANERFIKYVRGLEVNK